MLLNNKIHRIIVSDTDKLFCSILNNFIERSSQLRLTQNCNNGLEIINQLYKKQGDLFLIDLYTPIMTGLEAIKIIRNRGILTPIIAYSNTYQHDIAQTLNQLNNIYYCQKNSFIIINIIKELLQQKNEYYQDYKIQWQLNPLEVEEYLNKQQENYIPSLIERQIIKHACEGLSNKEIGDILSLSSRTIDGYIKKLTTKTQVKNKIQLIAYCVERGYHNFNS